MYEDTQGIPLMPYAKQILEYLKPDFVHILKDGNIKKSGDMSLALEIEKNGYNDITMNGNDENE